MINYKEPIDITMKEIEALRYCTSDHISHGKSCMKFVLLGNALYSSLIEEKQVENKIVRCLGSYIDSVEVIRNDGTVWGVCLSNFDNVTPVNVTVI